MQFPNYSNSSYNVINSLIKHFGVKNDNESLELLDNILKERKYKKIVFIVMDGMGNNLINKYIKDDFLGRKNLGPISTVFPSTTTASMNTYYSAKTPKEHAWLGWSNYFKECSRTINLFPGTDKYTHDEINFKYKNLIQYEDIFSQIKRVNNIEQKYIIPKGINNSFDVDTIHVKSIKKMIKSIKKELKSKKDKFIFAYSNEPDHTEHMEGVYNLKVEKIVKTFNKLMEKNFNNIKDDTLIIISADHGLIDIHETIYLEDYPHLLNTLYMLPSIEPRAASFVIKKDKKLEFETAFNELFQGKYVLFTREEVLRHNMFGRNELHPKADDFLGDYLAVAISNTLIDYKRSDFIFKGHHAGMSMDEMNIPLIVIKKY